MASGGCGSRIEGVNNCSGFSAVAFEAGSAELAQEDRDAIARTEQIGWLEENYVLVDQVAEAVSQGAEMGAIGRAGEAHVRADIARQGYLIAGEQVHVRTRFGVRVIDFLIWDGRRSFAAIEVKANTATRSQMQLLKDNELAVVGGTIISWQPLQGGLGYGQHIQVFTTEVNVIVPRTQ